MRVCKQCGKELDESCFYKQKSCKDGLRPDCKTCVLARCKQYRDANKDAAVQRSKKYRENNRDKLKARNAAYYSDNLERERQKRREYYYANRERVIAYQLEYAKADPEKVREYKRRHKANNPEAVKAEYEKNKHQYFNRAAQRRGRLKEVTPAWSRQDIVDEYYLAAKIANEAFKGMNFHVDHIVPLTSDLVCGLHAHTNLQLIPHYENLAKGNRYWPDMP